MGNEAGSTQVMRLVCQFRWVGRLTMSISARLLDGEKLGFTEFRQKTRTVALAGNIH